jgi:hypothetical protein
MYRGAKTYAEQCRQDSTIRVKWLQGWINGERWRDAQLPTNGNGHGAYQKQTISEQVKELALNNLERSGRML